MRVALIVLAVLCVSVGAVQPRFRALAKGQCPITDDLKTKDADCVAAKGHCFDQAKCSCDGAWVSGKCSGIATRRCCVPAAPGQANPNPTPTQAPAAPQATSKTICMTYDDGPWDNSLTLVKKMTELGVPSVFYVNCHGEYNAHKKDYLDAIRAGGHKLANHMCSHDIMTNGNYAQFYGTVKGDDNTCLTTSVQLATFKKNIGDNHQGWKDLGYEMKLLRFPGDGRFKKCLIKKAGELFGYVHNGWEYEVAPNTKAAVMNSYTFGHVTIDIGIKATAADNSGTWRLFGTGLWPSNGNVVLAHDLHYKASNKLDLLVNWFNLLKTKGYKFAILGDDGKCPRS